MKFKVRSLIKKSRDAAVLAVSVYNNPTTTFRTHGFVVLMNIAWTSLFHAIFERDGVKYYYRDRNDRRRYERIDGDYKAWEIKKCVSFYYGDRNDPIKSNLEFFAGLRDKIEHRFTPQIDVDVFGECQSYLINYEKILISEFGEKYALADTLVYALQFSRIKTTEQLIAAKLTQSKQLREIRDYIYNFRRGLDSSILSSSEYAMRVYLIQKVANHKTSADAAIEFIKFDPDKPEEMKKYEYLTALIKEKQVPTSLPSSVFIPARSEMDKHKKMLLVERKETDENSHVVVTKDAAKADGIMVLEKISKDYFDDARGVVDAAMLFHRRFGEVNLTNRALYFTYAGRHEVCTSEEADVMVRASYMSYTPFYYWLSIMEPSRAADFLTEVLIKPIYPKVYAVLRLIFALGNGPWRDYAIQIHDDFKHHSQKPLWVWFVDRVMENMDATEPILAALEKKPHNKILGRPIKDLVMDLPACKEVLTTACLNFSEGIEIDTGEIKAVDLIAYHNCISETLPPPCFERNNSNQLKVTESFR